MIRLCHFEEFKGPKPRQNPPVAGFLQCDVPALCRTQKKTSHVWNCPQRNFEHGTNGILFKVGFSEADDQFEP